LTMRGGLQGPGNAFLAASARGQTPGTKGVRKEVRKKITTKGYPV